VGSTFDHVNTAIKEATKNANQNDLIIVIGSIFLVAEVDRNLFA
jgi:folylpolyglutamate synthase/dihydropteroate synthase